MRNKNDQISTNHSLEKLELFVLYFVRSLFHFLDEIIYICICDNLLHENLRKFISAIISGATIFGIGYGKRVRARGSQV